MFCIAAECGHTDVVRLLLEPCYAVKPNWERTAGTTALWLAVKEGHFETTSYLLAHAKLSAQSLRNIILAVPITTWFGPSKLDPANAILELLVKDPRISVSNRDSRGRTLLSWAAENGNIAAMSIILNSERQDERRALLEDAGDHEGRTPLYYAAWHGHVPAIKVLSEAGNLDVQLHALGPEKENAIAAAARHGHAEAVQLLADLDPNGLDLETDARRTPLSLTALAADEAGASVARTLLSTGRVQVDSKCESGRTPLEYAVSAARFELMRVLVREGGANLENVIEFKIDGTPSLLVEPAADWERERVIAELAALAKDRTEAASRNVTLRARGVSDDQQ